MYWFLKIITFIPLLIMFPTRIVNRGRLIKGKVIYVCNHRSNLDPVILSSHLPTKPQILAKKELFRTKFKSWFLKQIGAIPVDREKPEVSTFKACIRYLNNDQQLLIFPEGTRNNSDKDTMDIKSGASVLASKTSTKIVPLWIEHIPSFFKLNRIYVGLPIEIKLLDGERLTPDKLLEYDKRIAQSLISLKPKVKLELMKDKK